MKTLVIGIGNQFRSDDAIGILVAREVASLNIPDVEVIEHSGEGASLLETWMNYPTVIIIDAVVSGAETGTTHILDACQQNIPSEFFHYSSHAFGLAEAVELARTLNKLPAQMTIFGVEGINYDFGESLSSKVLEAVPHLVEKIKYTLNFPS
ncbi:MAG: hydrogenase maturation protease [Ignavibacteriae bacterium]|nr:hydrogenase maturation protease [Ignavibacteriota bacterium]